MQGIDISSYQSGIDLSAVPCDFVWVKLTEGNGYVNPDAARQINQSLALGKPTGVYHYINGDQYETEFFRQRLTPWLGQVAVGVDWETGGNNRWGDLSYLDGVIKLLKTLTGLAHVVLYASEGVYPRDVAKRNDCPTWVAKYASMSPTGYQESPWAEGSFQADIRQYAYTGRLPGWNGNLDINKSYATQDQWSTWTGNGDDMTTAADVWNYGLGENAQVGKNNQPAWVRLSWMHHDTAQLVRMLCRTDDAGLKDGTNGDLYTRVVWMDKRIREMSVTVTAMSAAIEALSKATGADPATIGGLVSAAVKEKLDALQITVTTKDN